MSAITRSLSGTVLDFRLEEERSRVADSAILKRTGRSARTLSKEGDIRVMLVVLDAGAEIDTHRAAGPITVQVLDGTLDFEVGDAVHELRTGMLLTVPAGVDHAVRSEPGATFLLTVSAATAGGSGGAR